MAQKSKTELQGLFKTGAKPSQQDFADFIESTLNIKDDGVEKPSGADNPLKIKAQGTDEKLLDFYAGEAKTWSINQKPQPERIGLNISNSGVSRLFINSSNGNVGIGTTNPGAKLEISGDFKLQNGVAVNRISNDGALAGNSDLTIPTEKAIKIYADTKALLTGSSTQDFQTKNLTVNGNLKLQQGLTINTISNDGALAGNSDLAIPTEKAIKTYVDTKASLAGSSSQDFRAKILTVNGAMTVAVGNRVRFDLGTNQKLSLGGDGSFEIDAPNVVAGRFVVTQGGNVGIGTGTTNPGAKLEVKGDLKLQNGVAVNNISSDGTLKGNSDLAIPTEKAIKTYADTKALISGSSAQDFQTKNLTVTGSLSVAASAGSKTNIDLSGHIQLKEYGQENVAYFQARDDSSNRDIGLRIRTQKKGDSQRSIVDAITINPEGNVGIGIGIGPPGAKLEVRDTFKLSSNQNEFTISLDNNGLLFTIKNSFQGGANSNRVIKWDGDNNWDQQSDLSLKTDIENEDNILNRLMQLEVKNYRWKDHPHAPTKKIGFIAQDVQPLFPSFVGEIKNENGDESTLTLKYAEFGILAIGALRELKQEKDAEVNALKTQIQELQNMISLK